VQRNLGVAPLDILSPSLLFFPPFSPLFVARIPPKLVGGVLTHHAAFHPFHIFFIRLYFFLSVRPFFIRPFPFYPFRGFFIRSVAFLSVPWLFNPFRRFYIRSVAFLSVPSLFYPSLFYPLLSIVPKSVSRE
jgi:hypothetical protein